MANKDNEGSTAPKRTDADLAVDKRVEDETRRLAEVRRQQDELDLQRKESDFKLSENSLHVRALDASIGFVEHLGCRGRYIGRAPQREKGDSLCPSCQQVLTGGNSKFLPLSGVIPESGLLVKDLDSGEFFALPSDGTLDRATPETWLALTNPATGKSIVPDVSKAGIKERRAAAGLPV